MPVISHVLVEDFLLEKVNEKISFLRVTFVHKLRMVNNNHQGE